MNIKKAPSATNTSFHGDEITTTLNDLIKVFGQPHDTDIDGKVNYEWDLQLEDGTIFTIYDWKEYRDFGDNEDIDWHIGGKEKRDTIKARLILEELIPNSMGRSGHPFFLI